jgi:hypothetical protein
MEQAAESVQVVNPASLVQIQTAAEQPSSDESLSKSN